MTIQDQEVDELHLAVARALSAWNHVESGLFRVFHKSLGRNLALGPVSAAFIAADNIRTKLTMTDAAVRWATVDTLKLTAWAKAHKNADKLRRKRNLLAHRTVGVLQIGNSKPKAALMPYAHDIAHHHSSAAPASISRLYIKDVVAIEAEFFNLGKELTAFAQML